MVRLVALVQIAGAGKRPVLYCRDFKLGARHSTLQAQVDLGVPSTDIISTLAARYLRHDLGREDALSWGRKLRRLRPKGASDSQVDTHGQ
jgi:hypothetical protein